MDERGQLAALRAGDERAFAALVTKCEDGWPSGGAVAGVAVYPDGSWLPLLNGIETAPGPCPWPKEIPYAPVTGILKGEGGILWFGHADGSMSCVQMRPCPLSTRWR